MSLFAPKYFDRFNNKTTYPVYGLEWLAVAFICAILAFVTVFHIADFAKQAIGITVWLLISLALLVAAYFTLHRFLQKQVASSWYYFLLAIFGGFWIWGAIDLYHSLPH